VAGNGKYVRYNARRPTINLRVTLEQLQQLEREAGRLGLTRSAYIRSRVFNGRSGGGGAAAPPGGAATRALAKKLLLLMIRAGIDSDQFGVPISEEEVLPLVEELRQEGLI